MTSKGECDMTQITLSDLKTDPGKYVRLAQEQDIMITRYGKIVAKIVTADQKAAWDTITGIFRSGNVNLTDADIDSDREERIING